MKKKMLIVLTCVVAILSIPFLVNGQVFADCGDIETNLIDCEEGEDPVCHILNLVVEIMSIGIGILGVIGIVISGIQYMTAGGNEEKARKSKRRLLELVIGLALFAGLAVIVDWLNPSGLFCGKDGTGASGSLGNPTCFDDVYEKSSYQSAICWAKSKGIAEGDGKKFKPRESLKRSEGITLVWRVAGSPKTAGVKGCDIDGSLSGEYYYNAVLWGCSSKVMVGTNKGLEVNGDLTIKQFVTMLYRLKNPGGDGWDDGAALNWANADSDIKESGITDNSGKTIKRGEAVFLINQLIG